MPRLRRLERAPRVPAPIVSAAGLGGRDRLLAAAPMGGGWVLAGTLTLCWVDDDGTLGGRQPWHAVDRGTWDRDTATLTVTWVDGSPRSRWPLTDAADLLLVVRERVQASVVVAETLRLPGARTASAVIRQDLATREPFAQLVAGPGPRRDGALDAAAAAAFARLWDDIGMPPRPPGAAGDPAHG